MKRRMKIAVTVIYILLAVYVFNGAVLLLNMASDLYFYIGVLICLVSLVVWPTLFSRVWFKKEEHENKSDSA